jgi:large subunit ribosomal protein L4
VVTLKKYNLAGKVLGEVELDDEFLSLEVGQQSIKDYLVALRANARQWSANTKTRAEVCHSGQKPHPQKGTGRARQGYLGAPQYKGGGRVFAPRPKFDQHVRINKKERRGAIRHLLVEKIRNSKLHILDWDNSFKEPKTKVVAQFLEQAQIGGKRVLFLRRLSESAGEDVRISKEAFAKSLRNLPLIELRLLQNMNGYDLALSHEVVLFSEGLDDLMLMLKGDV